MPVTRTADVVGNRAGRDRRVAAAERSIEMAMASGFVPDGVGVGGEVAGGVPGGPPHHRPLRRQAAHILERPEEIDRGRRRWRWRRRRGRVGARVGLALGEHE